jgi:hypothetical protein
MHRSHAIPSIAALALSASVAGAEPVAYPAKGKAPTSRTVTNTSAMRRPSRRRASTRSRSRSRQPLPRRRPPRRRVASVAGSVAPASVPLAALRAGTPARALFTAQEWAG